MPSKLFLEYARWTMAHCPSERGGNGFHTLADVGKQLRRQIESGHGKALSDEQLKDLTKELSFIESQWGAKTPLPALFAVEDRR